MARYDLTFAPQLLSSIRASACTLLTFQERTRRAGNRKQRCGPAAKGPGGMRQAVWRDELKVNNVLA
jgi:hypothetical protein